MCAKKVAKGPGGLEERKALVLEHARKDEELEDSRALRIVRTHLSWRDWLLYDFLRYWYGIGALALLVFSVMHIAWAFGVDDPLGLAALAVVAVLIAAAEVVLYLAIWPHGAFTEGWPLTRKLARLRRRLRWRT